MLRPCVHGSGALRRMTALLIYAGNSGQLGLAEAERRQSAGPATASDTLFVAVVPPMGIAGAYRYDSYRREHRRRCKQHVPYRIICLLVCPACSCLFGISTHHVGTENKGYGDAPWALPSDCWRLSRVAQSHRPFSGFQPLTCCCEAVRTSGEGFFFASPVARMSFR
jgi:hypothetical protein